MKQITGIIAIGRLKVIFARVGAYFGYINFLMILVTFYSIKGYKYAPLWLYLVGMVVGVIAIGIIDYLIMLPCEISFTNEQIVKHQSPIYDEIVKIREYLEKLCEK